MDAKRVALQKAEALALAGEVDEIYAAKGKRLAHVCPGKEHLDEETLLGLLLGPTGKLRAPTMRVGRTLLVGFDEATYRKLLC